jgi:hypothetical protein
MAGGHARIRTILVGAGLSVAVALGAAACGSSAKTNPGSPAGGTISPASTTPPTTAPSSGGVSY